MTGYLRIVFQVLLMVGCSLSAQTVTGPALPGTEPLDAAVLRLLTQFSSPGAQFAVAFKGRLVLARGYGIADRAAGVPVQPDALFRVGSNSKPLTALAILTLVDQGKLSLDLKVFPFLGLSPLPGANSFDPRVQNITVRHLLNHTAGWDSGVHGDFVFFTTAIAAAAGVPAPADVDTIIRFHLGRQLDFEPGTRFAYSNFGFMVLGRLIEKVSSKSYGDYVRAEVLAKAGVTRAVLSRSLLENRQLEEVRYYDYPGAPFVPSVFPPTNALVPFPYGGFYLEALAATGGWAISAVDYVRLLCALDGTKPGPQTVLEPATIDLWTERPPAPVFAGAATYYALGVEVQRSDGPGTGATWLHAGSLPGSRAVMIRFASGWTCALAFNTRIENDLTMDAEIGNALLPIFGTLAPPSTGDLFATSRPEVVAISPAQTVNPGAMTAISTSVSSVTSPTFQWFKNGAPVTGGTNASLAFAPATAASAGNYHVVVTNAAGAITSPSTTLTVNAVAIGTPQIVTAPVSLNVEPGATGRFFASVTSPTPTLFQWYKDGAAIPGATTSTLTVPNATALSAGTFQMVVANAVGATASDPATLSVGPVISPGHLVNLSVLTGLSNRDEELTLGYVVGGSGTVGAKALVVRAAGPSLGAFVEGVLADPRLELFAGPAKAGENDDWGGLPTVANAMATVGAFAFASPSSRDAAVVGTVSTRDNSVKVSGTGAGMVIAEVYDATPAAGFTATTPRLINVSVLKPVGGGFSVGFVIGGTTRGKVLIRAIGPALSAKPFERAGTVDDPQLSLFANSTKIGENNDWGGTAELTAVMAQVGAFSLPANSKDAAFLATLQPGNYSVQVSSVGNSTGDALVEVYEVP